MDLTSDSIAVTVGAGGTAGTVNSNRGGTGGVSSLGAIQAAGGGGGSSYAVPGTPNISINGVEVPTSVLQAGPSAFTAWVEEQLAK